jgi:hypothetical protein
VIAINFNKTIYKAKAINSAIKDYKGLADFELKQDKKYYRLILKNIDKEVEQIIKDEFCNYVLYLIKTA